MEAHSRYFDEHFAAGRLLLYGPVMATNGAFGLAVLEVERKLRLDGLVTATHQ